MNSTNWPASSVWVFIAQLMGEHCSANAEATGSNPVEAPKTFFSGYFRNCLNCDSLRWSHNHFMCIPAVHIISFKISSVILRFMTEFFYFCCDFTGYFIHDFVDVVLNDLRNSPGLLFHHVLVRLCFMFCLGISL